MIGNVIQKKRKELGLTQSQLADRLGVTAPAVNRWEKNLSFPDTTLLAPLARLLQTDLNELFSFYDSLSDKERKLIVDEAKDLFLDGKHEEALIYIDNVLKQNLSDGELYKEMANLLFSFVGLKRYSQNAEFLNKIAKYFERAIELVPDENFDVSLRLIQLYSSLGEQEKAELLWSQFPDNHIDKQWKHTNMLCLLGQYDKAISEMKTVVLRDAIELSERLNALEDILNQNNEQELSLIAKAKAKELRNTFELWEGFEALNHHSNIDGVWDSFLGLLDNVTSGNKLTTCPLFEDVILGRGTSTKDSYADLMSDMIKELNRLCENSERNKKEND